MDTILKINGWIGQLANLAIAVFSGDDADLSDWINQQTSLMCQTIRVALLNAGLDVDFAAEFRLPDYAQDTPDAQDGADPADSSRESR
jgi:hypothetical protein